jgi:hypothetical protein
MAIMVAPLLPSILTDLAVLLLSPCSSHVTTRSGFNVFLLNHFMWNLIVNTPDSVQCVIKTQYGVICSKHTVTAFTVYKKLL